MQCPKCRGNMRTYERNGVHIEQCDNCRGIFLDYGELETLSNMESQWHGAPPSAPRGPSWGAPHGGHGGGHHGQYGRHRQRSWVGMLFSS